jgi:acyl-CoA synthetase (AMP-forming)/AMP-acid ligase II
VSTEFIVPGLLRRNTDLYGDKPVMVTPAASFTHADLDRESRLLATRLIGAGVGRSARVGLMMPNGIEWLVTAVAVMRMGATLVPLSTLLKPPELAAQLRTADVSHLILVREYRGRSYLNELEEVAPGICALTGVGGRHLDLPQLQRIWPADALPELPTSAPQVDVATLRPAEPLPAAPFNSAIVDALGDTVRPADPLAILFTSGSSGTPKGVIHTHGNALRATAAGLETRRVSSDTRLYIPMPFFWTGGFGAGLLTVLVAGATLLTDEATDAGQTLEFLERERATLFRGWPDQAVRIAAHPNFATADLSALSDGSLPAVLPPDRRPGPGVRANIFGMTETCGPYSGSRLDQDLPESKRGSCGRPFDGIEIRIVDPEGGQPSAAGEPGEIRLRGPNLMVGICGRLRERTFDRDGFYPTGDLGVLDADGYLWYRGRLDDMFKVKGATVYPSEVEAALRGVDGVRQAFVSNVRDEHGVDAVGALVVSELEIAELTSQARSRLSSFKVPQHWVVVQDADAVPMLATGKIDKQALRELLAQERRGR